MSDKNRIDTLWMAVPVKQRFTLTFESHRPQLYYHLAGWKQRDKEIMVSPTAVVKIDRHGQRVQLLSRNAYAQRIMIVNRKSEQVIGTVEITAQGSMMMTDGKKMKTDACWQTLYTTQTVAVIGIEGAGTFCIVDEQATNEYRVPYDGVQRQWNMSHMAIDKVTHDIPGLCSNSRNRSESIASSVEPTQNESNDTLALRSAPLREWNPYKTM